MLCICTRGEGGRRQGGIRGENERGGGHGPKRVGEIETEEGEDESK